MFQFYELQNTYYKFEAIDIDGDFGTAEVCEKCGDNIREKPSEYIIVYTGKKNGDYLDYIFVPRNKLICLLTRE